MTQNDERAFNGDCTLVALLLVIFQEEQVTFVGTGRVVDKWGYQAAKMLGAVLL